MSCTEPTFFAIPPPQVHIDGSTYFSYYTPCQLVYFLSAVLVTLPGTYSLRLAILPVSFYVLYRAATELDMSNGNAANEGNNLGLMTLVGMVLFRLIGWSFQTTPYVRVGKGRDASNRTISQILLDAADLCCNFRGIGWDWSSEHVYINPQPDEVKKQRDSTSKRNEFIRENVLSYFVCSAIFEVGLKILFTYPLEEPTSNDTLSNTLHLLKRIGHSFLYPVFTYTNLGGSYNVYALFSVCVLGQGIEEWPPFYNQPWKSTSLTEFWGKRWHQAFRYTFSLAGGKPLSWVIGRAGLVIGTFLASGVFHDMGYWGMHRGHGICCYTTPYFFLNGVGIILEAAMKGVTGKRVGGPIGWLWTLTWLVACAMVTMSPYCMQDLLRSFSDALLTQPFTLGNLLAQRLMN